MELLPPEIGTELLRNLERNLVAGGWVLGENRIDKNYYLLALASRITYIARIPLEYWCRPLNTFAGDSL